MKVTTQLIVRIAPKVKRQILQLAKRRDSTIQAEVEDALRDHIDRARDLTPAE